MEFVKGIPWANLSMLCRRREEITVHMDKPALDPCPGLRMGMVCVEEYVLEETLFVVLTQYCVRNNILSHILIVAVGTSSFQ